MSTLRISGCCKFIAVILVFYSSWSAEQVDAFDRYSVNRDATNCRACHGRFGGVIYKSKVDNSTWQYALHDVHQIMLFDGNTYGCPSCHQSSSKFPVYLKTSSGAAPFNVSCLGCHGRNEGAAGISGAGLMQRHYRKGITTCENCHSEANPANFQPVGENVKPPLYYTPDPVHPNKPTDSCNNNNAETRTASARGLDNDGDLLDDLADPDCASGPDTTLTGTPANPTNSTSAGFTFTSNVAGSTFECNLDNGGFGACTSPVAYSGLPDGVHTFLVRSIDPAGNPDLTPAAYTWTIDSIAPDTMITTAPANPSNSTSASFSFTSTETGSFECGLDGGAYGPCSSPASYAGLANGAHSFTVRAKDAAGNQDPSPALHTWTIDTIAPDTTITSAPPNLSNSASASFSFTSTEAGSFECGLDGGAYSACTSPSGYAALSNGAHSFSVRAKDVAGNQDPSPAVYTWTIDTIAPDTTITSAPPNPSYSQSASFVFTATEISTFECNLDSGGYLSCTSPATYTNLVVGNHSFAVRSKDAVGNQDPTPASYAWAVAASVACWDLNGNGICDQATEDRNGDGQCDAVDCESMSVTQVHDANGQYLGKFLGHNGKYIDVFVPSLKRSVSIAADDGSIPVDKLYYVGTSCSGQAYASSQTTYGIFRNAGSYYGGSTASPAFIADIESYFDGPLGQCVAITQTSGMYVVPVDVTLPFTPPAALPLRIE